MDAAASPAAAGQLTLLNTTVNNGTVTNNGVLDLTGGDTIQSGVFSNTGTTDVSGTGNAIDNETSFTNSNLLEVLAGGALTLSGDTVTNASGTIKVDAAASPAAAGQLTLLNTTVNNGTVTNNGVLDLTGGDTIQSGVFSNTGTTDVSGTGNAIDNETSFTNSNLLEVLAGGALTLSGDTVTNASGTIKVDAAASPAAAGQLTLLNTTVTNGSVTNNGVLDLTGGDTIQGGAFSNTGTTDVSGTGNAIDNETSFTNSNLLEVLAGGALTLSGDTVTNTSGTIKVDAAASPAAAGQLTLLNTTVTNGSVTNNGVLDLTGGDTIQGGAFSNTGTTDVSGTGNAIDNETSFTNSNLLEVLAGGALTLSGDTVTNTSGTIKVDAAASPAAAGQLTLLNTTVTNGSVTNNGVLDLTGGDTIQGGAFSNTGTTDVSGTGNAIDNETSFTNSNLLEVLAGGALTLSGDTVTNTSGTIKVDAAASPAAAGQLTLLNTTVTNGSVTNNGVLDLTGGDTIQGGAFSNTGTTDVSGTGNAIDNETSFTNSNLLEVLAGGALTLSGDTVTNTSGTIKVDAAASPAAAGQLTLLNTTVTNGSVTNNGVLDLTGGDTIQGGAFSNTGTTDVSGTGNAIDNETSFTNSNLLEVLAGGALTLSGDTVTNTSGTIKVDAAASPAAAGQLTLLNTTVTNGSVTNNGVLDLTGGDTIQGGAFSNTGTTDVSGTGNAIDNETSFTNSNLLEVLAGGALTLSGDTVTNTSGTIKVDAAASPAAAGQLTLLNTTVTNGSVTNNGVLDLTGGDTIQGGAFSNTGTTDVSGTGNAIDNETSFTNSNLLEVLAGGALTLSGDTVTNTSGTIKVDAAASPAAAGQLTLLNTTVTNGSVTNNGVLDLTGGDTIQGGAFSNTGTTDVSGTGNAIDNETSFTNSNLLEVLAGGVLTLSGDTVTNTSGTIKVDAAASPAAAGQLTLLNTTVTNGSVTNNGVLDLTGGDTIQSGAFSNTGTTDVSGTGNAIDNETSFTNSNLLEVLAGGALTLSGDTVTNTSGTIKVDAAASPAAAGQLTLLNTTVTNGSVTNNGVLDLTGGDTIQGGAFSNTGTTDVSGTGNAIDNETSFTNSNLLEVLAGGALTLSGDTVTNTSGTIQIDGGGTLTLAGTDTITGTTGSSLVNNGAINVTGNTTISVAAITGSGSDVIDAAGAVLTLNAATDAQTVTFSGNVATLTLMQPTNFKGAIDGLVLGDVIDFPTLTITSAVISGSTLVVNNNPALTYTIAGAGSLANDYFAITSDGVGGDELVLSAAAGPVVDLNGPASGNNNTVSDSGTTPILIAPSATITDSGSSSLASMTITLTNPQDDSQGGGGINVKESLSLSAAATALAAADHLTVTITTNTTSSTILIQGAASLADYQTILEGVEYTDIKSGSRSATPRIVDVQVNDGTNNSNLATVTINVAHAPAGVAGAPINLALTDPSGGQASGPITLTFTGVPSGWSLNQGTNLGNGTWTVVTNDLSALTVTTIAAFAGATVLGVTESWTNTDGSTGTATVADNVEAYAPGSPIFALSGNDTLTGAGSNNEFVFAQPIGNDTIYNFNTATDKIDLMGFASVASFSDVQASTTTDANGNAVITLGNGETITLIGVHAASLTAADFAFNQTPVVDNTGTMVVSDGAILPLGGTIDNTGTIALNSTGDQTELEIVGGGITLEGGGQVVLSDNNANMIVGTTSASILTNVDNTISGAGQIGTGDGTLTLVNEVHGTIEADVAGGTLTLDTGNVINNNGVLEAMNGGTLHVDDSVQGGSAVIAGGTLEFGAASDVAVQFENGTGTPSYGELVLNDAKEFSGQISGFAGTAPDAAHSDTVDLAGFAETSYSAQTVGSNEVLTLHDANGDVVTLTFDNFSATLDVASDGNGGTLITDLPNADSTGGFVTSSTSGTGTASTSGSVVASTGTGFVSNQTTVVENASTTGSGDGATQPPGDTIDNTGTIALNSPGDAAGLQNIGGGITLEGGGQVVLSDSSADLIVGTTSASSLTNVDNTISGAGQIGTGNGDLTLVNQTHGTIEADVAGGTLTLDTGNVINNNGVLEAINGGTLRIDDSVHGGSAVISGGTLEFGAASDVAVQFHNGTGSGSGTPSYGELVLDDAKDFSGQISGFAGTAPDAAHSDTVDLAGFVETSYSVQTVGNNEVLTLHDSSGDVVTLTFDNFSATLDVASDGEGGTLIADPPAANSSAVSASAPTTDLSAESAPAPTAGSSGASAFAPTVNDATVQDGVHVGEDDFNFAVRHAANQASGVTSGGGHEGLNQSQPVLIGGVGNDNFLFHPSLDSSASNHNSSSEAAVFEQANAHDGHQAGAPLTSEAPFELSFDPVHHDAAALTSQFHQIVASATHLH